MPQFFLGRSFGFILVDAARLFRQTLEKAVEDAGLELTPGEFRTLAYVARYAGSRQATLAERMGVEPMTLSAYLDRLEARGLITRLTDPTDRRAKIIETTPEAQAVFDHARPIVLEVYERVMAGIGEDERQMVEATLEKIRANLTADPSGPSASDAPADPAASDAPGGKARGAA